MMKKTMLAALVLGAGIAHAQTANAQTASAPIMASGAASAAKKELVQKILTLQQPGLETLSRNLVQQPAIAMMQEAGRALQQLPPDKREAAGKQIDADAKKYVDESVPLVRDRAIKLAPSTIGVALEEKFSEDELKQLVAWLEAPVTKKFAQLSPEIQSNFTQKLVADARPSIEPKLQALEGKVRTALGVPSAGSAGPAAAPASAAATRAAPAKKAASSR